MNDEENPSDEQLIAAGFDLADDLDRPDRSCVCPKCAAFYDAIDGVRSLNPNLVQLCRYGTPDPGFQTQPCNCAIGTCSLGKTAGVPSA